MLSSVNKETGELSLVAGKQATADKIFYDNSESGIAASNVQDAIDKSARIFYGTRAEWNQLTTEEKVVYEYAAFDEGSEVGKHIIFIGDSYGVLYRNNTTTLPEQLAPYMTKYGYTMYHKFVSGAGFCNGGFLSNLQSLDSEITDKGKVFEIWVLGGWNDEITRNGQTIEQLQTAMTTFATYAKANYPNAKLCLSFYSFGFDVITDTTHSQAGYELTDLGKVRSTYTGYASTAGFGYVKGLEGVFHNLNLMEPNDGVTDGGHPNDAGLAQAAKNITDILLTGETTINYHSKTSPYWQTSGTICNLAPNVTSTSDDKWYWIEDIKDYEYRLFTYLIAGTNSAPVFNFSGSTYAGVTLNCVNLKFGYWKAELAVPFSQNFVIDVPIAFNYTPTGSSTPKTIYYTAEFMYSRKSENGHGQLGYDVSFRTPILEGGTTGTLNWICIQGSAQVRFDTRNFC